MATYEGLKGGFIAMLDKTLQEMAVRQAAAIWQNRDAAKMPDDSACLPAPHGALVIW